ncbi:PASTA domain-containing protein [Rhodococcus artemisiae]|uniref:PASTA domain-containing protein n=1 Tax=Rhodococcus artemisiae TaxID=714159 RepID=A0ABU7LF61_9NOCA|nr:PASTA domain-containing protein [Rhodococcus artemisiae]MEE2060181.1 PASTA domain-containing protein [Rhodococcus artemisiae]
MAHHNAKLEVPDVVGLNADDACAIVRGTGLLPVGPDGAAAPATGVIVAQEPSGSAVVARGTEVVLWNQDSGGERRDASVPHRIESAELDPA